MKIGEQVNVRMGATVTLQQGTIVYVHPAGRYAVADVELPYDAHVRETVYPYERGTEDGE